MTTPANCPGCGTKLEPEAETCPNCPMSFTGTADEGPNPLRHESRARAFVLPAAFFGLLGFGVWKLGTGLLGVGMDASQLESGSLSTGGAPATAEQVAKTLAGSLPSSGAASAAPSTSAPAPAPSSDRVTVMPADGPGDAGEGQGTISVVKDSGPSAVKAAREWRLRGAVYDLVTLKPVGGAKIVFTDNETNARAETVTSANGRYKTVLPPLVGHGYLVAITKPGYAASYAGPESAGVADLDAGSRKELARQLGRSVEAPASLEPGSDAPYVTDFFLAPLAP